MKRILPLLLMLPVVLYAQDPPTFSCEYEGFRIRSGEAYSVDPATSDETYLGEVNPATNAIGYNATDDYIWGSTSSTSTGKIVRVASDLSTDVYTISGLPSQQMNVGDVSADGVLYMRNSDYGTIYRVDVNPESATYLQKLDNLTTTVSPKYRDWAFSPVDGNLYAVDGNGQLVRIDPATGSRTNVGVLNGAPEDFYGTAFMDGDGTLYIVDDQSGDMYKIPNVHEDNLNAEYIGTNTGGASSSDGAMCHTSTALPVRLAGFKAQAQGCSVQLDWSSAHEDNFHHYALERSADGRTYGAITTLPARGNNSSYAYTDESAAPGNNYYRLRMVDNDGSYAYSKVATAAVSCGGKTVTLYPNPAGNRVTVGGVAAGQVLYVTNLIGQRVQTIPVTGSSCSLDLSGLSAATYYITVVGTSGNVLASHKLVKQ